MIRVPFRTLTPAIRRQEAIDEAFLRVIESGIYIGGSEVRAFEAAFAEYIGTRCCVGVGNGFDALQLVLRALGVSYGDEVLVPSNTCLPTWAAISAVGATPVPVEPDYDTMVITALAARAAITPNTKAVIVVHLYGLPVDTRTFNDFPVPVIEDACQAHGASIGMNRIGSLSTAAAFSFYPTKNLGAFGDAGAIVTDDVKLAARLREMRSYGVAECGINSRLDPLQAAFLRAGLPMLDSDNYLRRMIAERYSAELRGPTLPVVSNGVTHCWHQYVIRTQRRDLLHQYLHDRKIDTMIHYPVPPAMAACYASLALSTPVAERLSAEVLSLPIDPHLSAEQVSHVISAVNAFFKDGEPCEY